MVNVLLDSGNAPPKTGIGIYGQLLVRAMQTYCPEEITITEAAIGYPAHTLRPLRRLFYLIELGELRRKRFRGADVVHYINQYAPARRKDVSYVVSIHDLDPLMLPSAHTRRFALYYSRSIRLTTQRAHLIVTQSEAVRCEVLEHFRLSPSSVCVGGDGLSEEFTRLADETRKSTPAVPVLLYVGQLSKKKNIAWVVRTLREGLASGALPPLRLELAGGEGFGSGEIRTEIEQSGSFVHWHDRPSLETIVSLYCSCSAVLLASLREGFGRPLLEAMYCDKPIIASRIPTSEELAGSSAHYFAIDDTDEFYEAVRNALQDTKHDVRTRLAPEVLERYSWRNLANVYSNIYQRAVWLR